MSQGDPARAPHSPHCRDLGLVHLLGVSQGASAGAPGSEPAPQVLVPPFPALAVRSQQERSCLTLPVLRLPLCPRVTGLTPPPARPFPLGTPWS